MHLVGIVAQVVQQGGVLGEYHLLVVAPTGHAQPAIRCREAERFGSVSEVVLPADGVAPAILKRTDRRRGEQRSAVALPRRRRAEPVEQRRHEIDALGEGVDVDTAVSIGGPVRVADDQRHGVGLIEKAHLADQPVIAHLFAVIRGEHDQRVLPGPGLLERIE